jgi:PEP-CTERM motif
MHEGRELINSSRTVSTLLLFAIFLVCLVSRQATAEAVPIDQSLFTFESTPGIASWAGNTLTLDLSVGGPNYGGFTQTALLPTSTLPADIVGISFSISSSLAHPRISFAYVAYDNTGHGQGAVDLVNYVSGPSWDLTTWTALTSGLGGGRTTSDQVLVDLGSDYSPFSLSESYHDPLSNYSQFSLDFRADGWNGQDYLPGTVTFANVTWICGHGHRKQDGSCESSVPEPATLALLGLTFAGLGWARRRNLESQQARSKSLRASLPPP